jgi:hypothetical protein
MISEEFMTGWKQIEENLGTRIAGVAVVVRSGALLVVGVFWAFATPSPCFAQVKLPPMDPQIALLRVLQQSEIEHVGNNKPRPPAQARMGPQLFSIDETISIKTEEVTNNAVRSNGSERV